MKGAVALILVLAISAVGWLIYQTSEGEELETLVSPAIITEEMEEQELSSTPSLPDTTWLLDSLAIFRGQQEEPEPKIEKNWGLSLNVLYSPLTQHLGFSSDISYKALSFGVTYASDIFLSVGYTFRF